jgi:putative redox protein
MLAQQGIAVLRFDFTGLGSSHGEFANTNFSSNIEDLVRAAEHLRLHFGGPAILVGHSLGGAAVLAAAHRIPEAKAVVSIGAPFDVAHILAHLGGELEQIEAKGKAEVEIASRTFTIERQFVENARAQAQKSRISDLRKALLVMHAPNDDTVGIDNAAAIFTAAKHPKSFVSLDGADHLLSNSRDARYVAEVIAAWASRFLSEETSEAAQDGVIISETAAGKFQNAVIAGRHRLLADEPVSTGGLDSGPNPYDFLAIALGACTAMTLRIYAEQKKIPLERFTVAVKHGKVAAEHCHDCGEAVQGRTGKIDRFERTISVEGGVDAILRDKLLEIAGKCPVHRTLEAGAAVVSKWGDGTPD